MYVDIVDIDRVIEVLKNCTNETDRQIAKWLEELKEIKGNQHKSLRYMYEKGYNKALDDVGSEFLKCENVHYNLQDILNVLNKVKAGGTSGTDNQ